MELKPGEIHTLSVAFEENADEVAQELARELGVNTVIGSFAAAHVTFLRDTVREELALALENQGRQCEEMAQRVDATLGDVDLDGTRNPATLSGGQTRRLALAQVAIARPENLIIVEPWAGLDSHSRERIAAYLGKLDQTAVVLVEHETQMLAQGGQELEAIVPSGEAIVLDGIQAKRGGRRRRWWNLKPVDSTPFTVGPVDLRLQPGAVLWLRGDNGSGKTTLLRAMAGLDGNAPAHASTSLALQSPLDQVIEPTIAQWIGEGTLPEELLRQLSAEIAFDDHPLDVSMSQLRVAQIAHVVAQGREVVLLDEPDTLLDARGTTWVHRLMHHALAKGAALVVTCHESRFVEEIAAYAQVTSLALRC